MNCNTTHYRANSSSVPGDPIGFLDDFDAVLVSGTVGLIKPDPAIYLLLIDRHAVDVRHSMFIDDSMRNVEAAAELGFDAIHFRSPEQLTEELRRRGLIIPVDSVAAGGVEGDQ